MYYIRENAKAILEENVAKYNRFKELNLKLDMSRGKPCVEQLDLTNGIFDVFSSKDIPIGSQDYRNYGIIDGIPERVSVANSIAETIFPGFAYSLR